MAAGRHLPDLSALVRGRQRRRGGGSRGDHRAARPPRGARGRGDLAVADLPLADGRLRLRRLRLLRRRPGLRHAGRPRRADRGLPRARDQARARLGAQPHAPTSIRGSSSRAPAATTPSATGTSGATSPTTGRRRSRPSAPRGRSTRPRSSTTCTASWPSSPTSTGTTRRSRPRCTTCCASGWTAASTACGSTRSHKIAKDPLLRDNVAGARRHDEDWESIHEHLRGIRKVVDEYDDRMIVGEVALQDLHRVVAYLEYGDQLHLAHNFVFIDQEWDAETYATSIADFEALAEEHAWPAWFLGNHDNPRPASRFDHDGLGRPAGARDPGDALRAQGHAVHLPGRGARAAGRADPAGPHRGRRRPRPRARADPVDARGAGPRLHDRRGVAAVRDRGGDAQRAERRPRTRARRSTSRARSRACEGEPDAADRRAAPVRRRPGILAWTRRTGGRRSSPRSTSPTRELPLAADGTLILSSDPDRTAASASLGPSEALLLRL